jgi:hypothetical protein
MKHRELTLVTEIDTLHDVISQGEKSWMDQLSKKVINPPKLWHRVYYYKRFYQRFAEARYRFNHLILPVLVCKYPDATRQVQSLATALDIWYTNPQEDRFICDLIRAIKVWLHETQKKSDEYLPVFRELRRQFVVEILVNRDVMMVKNNIHELMMYSTLLWCSRGESQSEMEYNRGLPHEEMASDVQDILRQVREYCRKLRFKRPQEGIAIKHMSPCEQWHELVLYIMSLFEMNHIIGKDAYVTRYENVDWIYMKDCKEIESIIEHPSFWLKKKFDMSSPIELKFNYSQWLQSNKNTGSLDTLPIPSSFSYHVKNDWTVQAQKDSHLIITSLAIGMWIVYRLNHWVIAHSIQL